MAKERKTIAELDASDAKFNKIGNIIVYGLGAIVIIGALVFLIMKKSQVVYEPTGVENTSVAFQSGSYKIKVGETIVPGTFVSKPVAIGEDLLVELSGNKRAILSVAHKKVIVDVGAKNIARSGDYFLPEVSAGHKKLYDNDGNECLGGKEFETIDITSKEGAAFVSTKGVYELLKIADGTPLVNEKFKGGQKLNTSPLIYKLDADKATKIYNNGKLFDLPAGAQDIVLKDNKIEFKIGKRTRTVDALTGK